MGNIDILILSVEHEKTSIPKDQDETYFLCPGPPHSPTPCLHNHPTSSGHSLFQELHASLSLNHVLFYLTFGAFPRERRKQKGPVS